MRKNRMKSAWVIYSLLFVLWAASGCDEKKEKSDIIAQVGESVLTVDALMEMLPNFDSLKLSRDQIENFIKRWVEREALYQEAIRSGFDRQEKIQLTLKKISKDYIVSCYIDQQINSSVSIAEAEIEKYYTENMDEFQSFQDEYHLRLILVATYNEAVEIRRNIKGSDDFTQWAKRRSLDGSRLNGGDLGYIPLNRISPLLARAIIRLKAQELSGPIKSEIGYNLIFLENVRKKGDAIPLAEVSDLIKERIMAVKREENYHQFLTKLYDKANVKMNAAPLLSEATN